MSSQSPQIISCARAEKEDRSIRNAINAMYVKRVVGYLQEFHKDPDRLSKDLTPGPKTAHNDPKQGKTAGGYKVSRVSC